MAKRQQRKPRATAQKNADDLSPSTNGKSARRRLGLPIAALLVAAMILGWVLRVTPHRCLRNAERAIESWQFEEAKRHLQNYPSWGTDPGRVFLLQARVDRHQAGFARAIEYLRSAQQAGVDPEAIEREEALINIQDAGFESGLMGRLEAFLDQAPEDHPAIFEVFANAYFHAGNPTRALELLDRWSEEYPRDGRPFYWKGWMLQMQDADDSALVMYAESTKRNPKLVDSYVAQAGIWSGRSRHDRAEQACRVACEIAPERLDLKIALATVLWKLHRKPEAVALLEPISRQDPSIYPAGRMVTQFHILQKNFESAATTLQPMMANFPDDASLNYMLASSMNELGTTAESSAAMKKFLIANENIDQLQSSGFDVPLDQQYQEVLRRALAYRRYDWEQSLKWLNLATQSQPDNPEPHELLARHYRESGQDGDATRHQNMAESRAIRR